MMKMKLNLANRSSQQKGRVNLVRIDATAESEPVAKQDKDDEIAIEDGANTITRNYLPLVTNFSNQTLRSVEEVGNLKGVEPCQLVSRTNSVYLQKSNLPFTRITGIDHEPKQMGAQFQQLVEFFDQAH